MTIYTGVADGNGDFSVPFSSAYTSGQKISVTASKDGAEKSIELYAPSETTGGGNIRFTGNVLNYPANIGTVELHGFSGTLNGFSIAMFSNNATGLYIADGVVGVGGSCFANWNKITKLTTPSSLASISTSAFSGLSKLSSLSDVNLVLLNLTITSIPDLAFSAATAAAGHLIIPDHIQTIGSSAFQSLYAMSKITIGTSVTTLGISCFQNAISCLEIICKPLIPPAFKSDALFGLNQSCVIKVPSGSLSMYKTAAGWSAHASKMTEY